MSWKERGVLVVAFAGTPLCALGVLFLVHTYLKPLRIFAEERWPFRSRCQTRISGEEKLPP